MTKKWILFDILGGQVVQSNGGWSIQKVKKSHLHDFAHLQPPGCENRSVVVGHHLETTDPEKWKEHTLSIVET